MKISMRSSVSASQRRGAFALLLKSAGRMRQKVLCFAVSSAAQASGRSVRRAVRMSRKPRRAYRRANSRQCRKKLPVIHTKFGHKLLLVNPEALSMASSSSAVKVVLFRGDAMLSESARELGHADEDARDLAVPQYPTPAPISASVWPQAAAISFGARICASFFFGDDALFQKAAIGADAAVTQDVVEVAVGQQTLRQQAEER